MLYVSFARQLSSSFSRLLHDNSLVHHIMSTNDFVKLADKNMSSSQTDTF